MSNRMPFVATVVGIVAVSSGDGFFYLRQALLSDGDTTLGTSSAGLVREPSEVCP